MLHSNFWYLHINSLLEWRFYYFHMFRNPVNQFMQYAISQLRIVRSGLHLVTYLDVGNFWDKSTERTLHEICVQLLLRFSDSNKPSQSVLLINELA